MKYLVKDELGLMYNVTTNEDDYIESYEKSYGDPKVLSRKPDHTNTYFQIEESLPSRFEAWVLDESE